MIDFTLTDTNRDQLPLKVKTLVIKTKEYGDLLYIQVESVKINQLGITELINLPPTLEYLDCSSKKIRKSTLFKKY